MMQTDKIGRATFHHIAPQRVTYLTNRELRWLKHIERHGPQSSVYLHELTKDTHRGKDTALRQLQKLRAGGYLHLPHQQRATEYANFKPFIYDLTPKAKTYLFDQGLAETITKPKGLILWFNFTNLKIRERHGGEEIPFLWRADNTRIDARKMMWLCGYQRSAMCRE